MDLDPDPVRARLMSCVADVAPFCSQIRLGADVLRQL